MKRGRSQSISWLPVLLCLTGVAATALPGHWQSQFRGLVHDGMTPGLTAVTTLRDNLGMWRTNWQQSQTTVAQLQELERKIAKLQFRENRLLIENARSRDRISQLELSTRMPKSRTTGDSLVINKLLTARVLGRETASRLQRQAILHAGEFHGVGESAFVLESEHPVVDVGTDYGVDVGLDVYSGRAVVGRISRVGHWTSAVRLITDSDYQALARLGRPTDTGMLRGAVGRLRGDGSDLCRLSVDSKQLVRVGDLVFTEDGGESLPDPMVYGQVVKATLRPGAVEWNIWVKPAANLQSMRKVQVLRQLLNPLRVLAQ